MTVRRVIRGAVLLLAFGGYALADDQAAPAPPAGPPVWMHRGGGFMGPFQGHFGEVRELFPGKVVKGAPYSAQVTTEFVQTLADGNRITQKTTSALYRDSEGRTRREETFGAIGSQAAGHSSQKIFISDPVAGTQFVLSPDKKEALQMPAHTGAGTSGGRSHGPHSKGQASNAPERQTESLGKQTIGGIQAEGTRVTRTIPAGAMGNENPIEIVSERWYSPALQTVVLRKFSDPRYGETTTTWGGIKTNEPDHSLFSVPADYAVKDAPRFNRTFGPNPPTPPAH
jgi:hypothetical protein